MGFSYIVTWALFAMLLLPNEVATRCLRLQAGMKCDPKRNTCSYNKCVHFAIICLRGFYGLRCEAKCSNHCVENKCHLTQRGAEICTEGCLKGWKGSSCLERCPFPCSECNITTGACTDHCPDGFYGAGCTQECSQACVRCDKASGECTGPCKNGYYGGRCTKLCRPGCVTCDLSTGACLVDYAPSSGPLSGPSSGPSTAVTNTTDDGTSFENLHVKGSTDEDMLVIIVTSVLAFTLLLIIVLLLLCLFRTRRHTESSDKEDLRDAHTHLNGPEYTHIYDEIPEDYMKFPKERDYLTATFTDY